MFNEIDVVTELDDSPEADMIRKCDEADRTGEIPECTWVRKYLMTFKTGILMFSDDDGLQAKMES